MISFLWESPGNHVGAIWKQLEWHDLPSGGESVALWNHFLEAMELPTGNAGKRAATFNSLLRKHGHSGRLVQKRITNRAGDAPWLGTKAVLGQIYKFL